MPTLEKNCRRTPAPVVVVAIITVVSIFGPRLAPAEEATPITPRPVIAIESVHVVDVVSGTLLDVRTVLVIDDRIAVIAEPTALEIPAGATRVDGRGRYLIPGLVDMHVHLFNNASQRAPNDWAFPLFIANGVTGVREMAAQPSDIATVQRWRSDVARGELVAPFVLAAGIVVRGDDREAARQQVAQAHAAGADFVKVFSQLPDGQWRGVSAEARALEMPVCGHIPAEVSLLDAAVAGQKTNEHLTQVYEACSAREKHFIAARKGVRGEAITQLRHQHEREVLESFDQRTCDRTAAALAKTPQVQVPTLVLAHFPVHGPRSDFREDPRWGHLRVDEQARWQRLLQERPTTDEKLIGLRLEISRKIVRTLHAAGVRVLAGTDAPMPFVYPGFALHKEFELLVEAGLTPADALRSATVWPAEFLGMSDSRGSIGVGKRADLVLLDDDPLRDITHTRKIRAVILGGRLLERADLDLLLSRRPEHGGGRQEQ